MFVNRKIMHGWYSIHAGIVALSIAMISMGAIYLDKCPAERYIPIYLIVSGCTCIGCVVIGLIGVIKPDVDEREPKTIKGLFVLLGLFFIAWFIAGHVWINGIENNYDPNNELAPNYCCTFVYKFALVVTSFSYVLVLYLILTFCRFCRCSCPCRKNDKDKDKDTNGFTLFTIV